MISDGKKLKKMNDSFGMKQIGTFLNISYQTIVNNEKLLFPDGINRSNNSYRYCSLIELCDAYYHYWRKKPTWIYVSSFLYDSGWHNSEEVGSILLRLKANKKIN